MYNHVTIPGGVEREQEKIRNCFYGWPGDGGMLHGCIAAVGVTVRNPTSYGIAFCKTSYFPVDDVTFDYTTWNPIPLNLDGVHFDGLCHHGKISNLRGTCFDDIVISDVFAAQST